MNLWFIIALPNRGIGVWEKHQIQTDGLQLCIQLVKAFRKQIKFLSLRYNQHHFMAFRALKPSLFVNRVQSYCNPFSTIRTAEVYKEMFEEIFIKFVIWITHLGEL